MSDSTGQRGNVAVVVNPRAAQGRVGRMWPALEPRLHAAMGDFKLLQTSSPGHGSELVGEALRDGFSRIVSVGGDGTHFEVLNGFFSGGQAINPDAVMAVIPLGTGSDLARSWNIPQGFEAVAYAGTTQVIRADVGRITCTREDGSSRTCYFQNIGRIGIGGEVVDRVNHTTKRFGGFVSYLMGTLISLVVYRDLEMTFSIDSMPLAGLTKDFIIAKGNFDGGGMHVAPHARLDNGVFDLYHLGKIGALDAMIHLPKIYQGRLRKRPDVVKYFRGRRIAAQSPHAVKIEADGEMLGYLPAEIEILPRAITIAAGPNPRTAQRLR